MVKYILILLLLAMNTTYAETITVHDLERREVNITLPVEKIFLADSRELQTLDIVSGDNEFDHIVGMGDTIRQFFPDMAEIYFNKFPSLKNIPIIGKNGVNIDAESIIKLKPDLVIARNRFYNDFRDGGILQKLDAAGIKIVFIDFLSGAEASPNENTIKSIKILGVLLNKKVRANNYIQWYNDKLNYIKNKVIQINNKPTVLIEQNAGALGKDTVCCNYYGAGGVGALTEIVGANNVLAGIVPKNGGQSSLETILTLNPQYYILSGADWSVFNKNSQSVAMGYDKNRAAAYKQLQALAERKGISMLQAIKLHHVMVLYHGFYNGPLNILNIEAIAKFLYPETFKELDPDADLQYLHKNFLSIPAKGTFWLNL